MLMFVYDREVAEVECGYVCEPPIDELPLDDSPCFSSELSKSNAWYEIKHESYAAAVARNSHYFGLHFESWCVCRQVLKGLCLKPKKSSSK
jgi:hypothetical protein